ncbi:transposase [Sanyastnella coralliicola]|uniref:transposase n=1 Tax=Sanyastnella coralliicola TaxID=3069118 RepID=UPI0027BAE66F|nr:transposase [Longitalea sp. SCSIO 12813]
MKNSLRKSGWKYYTSASYFITINVKPRKPWFGSLTEKGVHLSPIGTIVLDRLQATNEMYSHVSLDHFIIMPDHIHFILQFDPSTDHFAFGNSEFDPQKGNLGNVVNSFKRKTTKLVREIHPSFKWQRNYHDRVIHDHDTLIELRRYIQQKPRRAWERLKG